MNTLPVKGVGRTVMTSDFVTVCDGILRYDDDTWESLKKQEDMQDSIKKLGEERVRRAGVILDISSDGYYNVEKCIPDFEKVISCPNYSRRGSQNLYI